MTTELGNAREVPSQKKLALCAGACTISPRSALADAPHSLPFLITDWSRRLIPGSSMAWKIGQSGGKGGGKSGGRPFLLSLPKPLVSLPPVLSAPPKAHHPAAGGRDWPGGIKVPLGSELEPWLPHHAVQKGTFEPFFTEGTGYPRRSGLGIDVPRCPAETDGPCLFTQRRVATIQARLMDSMPGGLKGQAASNSGRGTHSQRVKGKKRQAGRQVRFLYWSLFASCQVPNHRGRSWPIPDPSGLTCMSSKLGGAASPGRPRGASAKPCAPSARPCRSRGTEAAYSRRGSRPRARAGGASRPGGSSWARAAARGAAQAACGGCGCARGARPP